MNVTVCELGNDPATLRMDWDRLVTDVRTASSDLVLLPEMPWAPWVAGTRPSAAEVWRTFVRAHDEWMARLDVDYARAGVQVLACPRATGRASTEKWKAGGVAAAVTSGAFCLSSNRGGPGTNPAEWGGTGWIIEPEEGRILGLTSRERPVVTVAIDPAAADRAKRTYPRYLYAT